LVVLVVGAAIVLINAAVDLLRARMDPHDAEHVLLECLGEMLWRAQRSKQGAQRGVGAKAGGRGLRAAAARRARRRTDRCGRPATTGSRARARSPRTGSCRKIR
jgi:hypothetical protein